MIRSLKILGLVVIALLSTSAVAATVAHAEPTFTLETESEEALPLDATMQQKIGEGKEVFEVLSRNIECELAHLNGSVKDNSVEATMTPDYTDHTQKGNCRASSSFKVTVTENGCDYRLHKSVYDTVSKHYKGYLELICPTGKQLEFHIRNLIDTGNACTVTVPGQTAIGQLTYAPNGKHFDMSGTLEFVTHVHSFNEPVCGFKSGTSQEKTMKYIISTPITLTATEGGNEIGITMCGE